MNGRRGPPPPVSPTPVFLPSYLSSSKPVFHLPSFLPACLSAFLSIFKPSCLPSCLRSYPSSFLTISLLPLTLYLYQSPLYLHVFFSSPLPSSLSSVLSAYLLSFIVPSYLPPWSTQYLSQPVSVPLYLYCRTIDNILIQSYVSCIFPPSLLIIFMI